MTRPPDPTVAVYEQRAEDWRTRREPGPDDRTGSWVAAHRIDRLPVADLGCGPGWYTQGLGRPAVAIDATAAMLDLVPRYAQNTGRVRADLRALPTRVRSLGGALASKSYVHLPRSQIPMALADLHRSLAVDSPFELVVLGDPRHVGAEHIELAGDDFPGRQFSLWTRELLADVVKGAGFEIADFRTGRTKGNTVLYTIHARRLRSLPDTVGPDMRVLVCGLNPSPFSADAGVGFARPGNRFWPAARAGGLVTTERDARHALGVDGVGMTDLVKRATAAAVELDAEEYRLGLARLERLASWLRPRVICFVGLAGWRAAADRHARPGRQGTLGSAEVYVMPSTSGRNARASMADLTAHFRAVRGLALAN